MLRRLPEQEGKHTSFEYGRYGNPTSRAVEKKIACAPIRPLALRTLPTSSKELTRDLGSVALAPSERARAALSCSLSAQAAGTSCSIQHVTNPTRSPPVSPLASRSALELAEDALVSASGMCTATTMLLALVPQGGHIVTTTDCYRRTRQFIQTMLPKMGITVRSFSRHVCPPVLAAHARLRRPRQSSRNTPSTAKPAPTPFLQTTVIDPSDMTALEKALNDHKVSLFFSESPTNPYLRCVDVVKISEARHPPPAFRPPPAPPFVARQQPWCPRAGASAEQRAASSPSRSSAMPRAPSSASTARLRPL